MEAFHRDGFVRIEQVVPPQVVTECVTLLWAAIDAEPDDPGTWRKPVHWVGDMAQPPFAAAANVPVLHAAFDELLGPGRWQPRRSLGSFPLRFPHAEEPDDAGWHIEGSYTPPGETEYFTNVHSSYRALLMLFLFTDVDEANAPTRIRVGSHRDVPAVLAPYGERGAPGSVLSPAVAAASAHRPVALATGRAGDVFLCHPFLVHAAQPHHGTRPRFMAQPPLYPAAENILAPLAGTRL
ncbi:phytanoyl-CoA dioxygenase family protein [Actinoplanes sp. NPDC024001]|uniref:phytanoyl-CoA dioxygenase family protein n=1 Tax=Actinoplanes sp. NPDC024001 TaxID=3154598 RepID=UPI0033FA9576